MLSSIQLYPKFLYLTPNNCKQFSPSQYTKIKKRKDQETYKTNNLSYVSALVQHKSTDPNTMRSIGRNSARWLWDPRCKNHVLILGMVVCKPSLTNHQKEINKNQSKKNSHSQNITQNLVTFIALSTRLESWLDSFIQIPLFPYKSYPKVNKTEKLTRQLKVCRVSSNTWTFHGARETSSFDSKSWAVVGSISIKFTTTPP